MMRNKGTSSNDHSTSRSTIKTNQSIVGLDGRASNSANKNHHRRSSSGSIDQKSTFLLGFFVGVGCFQIVPILLYFGSATTTFTTRGILFVQQSQSQSQSLPLNDTTPTNNATSSMDEATTLPDFDVGKETVPDFDVGEETVVPVYYNGSAVLSEIDLQIDSSLSSCEDIPNLLRSIKSGARPSIVNALRRKLMVEDSSCFKLHAELFWKQYQSRAEEKKHIMLHIPKSGRTSICEAIKNENKLSVPNRTTGDSRNCWAKANQINFGPFWCCGYSMVPTTCKTIAKSNFDFIMNENYLGKYCHDRTYSVVIREPVARAKSHASHIHKIRKSGLEKKDWLPSALKVSMLGQWNYITWALSAYDTLVKAKAQQNSKSINVMEHGLFAANKTHLQIAMRRLLEMDYIIDLKQEDKPCRDYFFQSMKINSTAIRHINVREKWEYQEELEKFSPQYALLYETNNALDTKLYQLSSTLINLDCKFLQLVGAFGGGTAASAIATANQIKRDRYKHLQSKFKGRRPPQRG